MNRPRRGKRTSFTASPRAKSIAEAVWRQSVAPAQRRPAASIGNARSTFLYERSAANWSATRGSILYRRKSRRDRPPNHASDGRRSLQALTHQAGFCQAVPDRYAEVLRTGQDREVHPRHRQLSALPVVQSTIRPPSVRRAAHAVGGLAACVLAFSWPRKVQ